KAITDEALDVLAKYPWPGNVRELKNVINRAAVLTQEDEISPYIIKELLRVESHSIQGPGDPPAPRAALRKIDLAERETIVKELNRTKWNKTRAAKNLGIAKSTLFEKLRRYDIKTPDMQ
ncbi:MAG: sigma-54-dependent Fis family transcriptional regulator, partial [Deltaproteobacteria bacterium]|nr:sigma-54-dependent Fis family transcriptional regulator [Deltaproteobacteria bacterium]NIS76750.1 sigma-54-dependent Fis family transcriptional regulator [Deltaproteobacteria bacterium]